MSMAVNKKKIGFIGVPAWLQAGSKDNTGNMIHSYAARSIFPNCNQVNPQPSAENLAKVRENCTHIGFIVATVLNVNKVPEYIASQELVAEFIEKLNLPVTAFGFGCQAPLGQSVNDAEVDPRSIRLLRAISERANVIGVRGEFTADLCEKYGVKNIEIIGCQSCYVAGVANWGLKPDLKVNTDRSVANLSFGPDESHLLRLIMDNNADIIGQTEPTEEGIKLGSISREEYVHEASKFWERPYLQKLFERGVFTRGEYFDYIRQHFLKFYNVPEWIEFIRGRYDFCFGTRFHGNMVALWAGVPALWLVHDMRTKELCNHLALPNINHAKLANINNLNDLVGSCDYTPFWNEFPKRLGEFMRCLEKNDIVDLIDPVFFENACRISNSNY